jgi:hypothetical protein
VLMTMVNSCDQHVKMRLNPHEADKIQQDLKKLVNWIYD